MELQNYHPIGHKCIETIIKKRFLASTPEVG